MIGSVVANCLYDWIEFDFNCRKVCREKSSIRTDEDNLLNSRLESLESEFFSGVRIGILAQVYNNK